ncbi:MAG: TonB family protein [Bacteroidetes bacterium]|nr:TonB family protein [Bacteroidota bacterium]
MSPLISYLHANATQILNIWITMQLQTAVFILLVFAVDSLLRDASPRVRYLLWLTALLKSFIPPLLLLPVKRTDALGAWTLPTVDVAVLTRRTATSGIPIEMIAAAILIAASMAMGLFVLFRMLQLRRGLSGAAVFTHDAWRGGPRVFVSDRIDTPLALGLLRPRIFITEQTATAPRHLQHAVLHHEREHLRRHDGLVAGLQMLAQVVAVLNPLVWLMNMRLFRYREQICDEAALQAAGLPAREYGDLLLAYAGSHPAPLMQVGTCFFETRRGFTQRISQLFQFKENNRMKGKHRFALIVLLAAIVPLSWQCSDPTVSYFEVDNRSFERTVGDSTRADAGNLLLGGPVSATVTYEKEGKLKTQQGPRIVGGLKALAQLVEYPEEARKKGIEGTVVIQASVDRDGQVVYATVICSANPLLDDAAVKAVKAATFKAARRNGKVLSGYMNIPIRFSLGPKSTAQLGNLDPFN